MRSWRKCITHVRKDYPSPYNVDYHTTAAHSDTTTDSEFCPSPNTEGFSLPNQLSDSWKRSVNTWPTLWRSQSLLNTALFEWCESEGAVGAWAQYFVADGFLAHQGGGGGGEDFILAAVLVIQRLLTFLKMGKIKNNLSFIHSLN